MGRSSQVQLSLGPSGVCAPPGVEQVSMSNPLGGDDTRVFTGDKAFDSRISLDPDTQCWIWTGYKFDSGYGGFKRKKRIWRAHRLAYLIVHGDLPADGLVLDHLCRNKACVNPAHLEPVTPQENVMRSPLWPGNLTHCKRGHEFTPENTTSNGLGGRRCCACHREYSRLRMRRKRLADRLAKENGQ